MPIYTLKLPVSIKNKRNLSSILVMKRQLLHVKHRQLLRRGWIRTRAFYLLHYTARLFSYIKWKNRYVPDKLSYLSKKSWTCTNWRNINVVFVSAQQIYYEEFVLLLSYNLLCTSLGSLPEPVLALTCVAELLVPSPSPQRDSLSPPRQTPHLLQGTRQQRMNLLGSHGAGRETATTAEDFS